MAQPPHSSPPTTDTPSQSHAESAPPPSHDAPAPLDLTSPQLTLRAVLTGMFLGAILSTCNVYAGLKIGWGFNMSITAALLSYGFWMMLHHATARRVRPWGILENNINQTACSSGAAVSSAGLVAPIPALAMITHEPTLDWHWLALWCMSVMLVGITVGIAVRRQMLLVDKLPFAFGIASAETLREMYAKGSEALVRVGTLAAAAVLAGGIKFYEHAGTITAAKFQALLKMGELQLGGFKASHLGFGLQPTALFYSVGALIGFRACLSLLIGSVVAYGFLAPPLISNGSIRLAASYPFPIVPTGLEPATDFKSEPEGYLKYNPGRRALVHAGVMTSAEREELRALHPDPFFREAIDRLYIASHFAAEQRNALVAAHSYTTTRRSMRTAPLPRWPKDFVIGGPDGGRITFDKTGGKLVAQGPVPAEQRDRILANLDEYIAVHSRTSPLGWMEDTWGWLVEGRDYLGRAAAAEKFRSAFEQLASLSPRDFVPPQPVPADLTTQFEFLEAEHALRVHGSPTKETWEAAQAWLGDDAPDWQATLTALRGGTEIRAAQPSYNDMVVWLLWPGVTLMVVSALVSFSFSWRSVLAAMTGFGHRAPEGPRVETGEVARNWFVVMLVVALGLSVWLQYSFFGIMLWVGTLGVLLTFVLALVAARVSGETSVTPVGAMGKVTQLLFGALVPGNPAPNLMAANVTGGAASQCADLLHDLKCGMLLGASPKWQVFAQTAGAFAGAVAGSAIYLVLVPNPSEMLMTPEWPAPAVATWKAVAELFMIGFAALPPGVVPAILIAAAAGVVLPIAEKLVPKKYHLAVPSAASLGLALVVPADYGTTMFIGGLMGLIVSKCFKSWSARFLTVICAGIVAGETLTAVSLGVRDILLGTA